MKHILIIGAGGQIPEVLIPLLQKQDNLHITLFGRDAESLPYKNVTKISGNAAKLGDLKKALAGQDMVYMNFDNKAITEVVIKAMNETGVKRIIQAGFLGGYGEVAEPFAIWNSQMMGGNIARNRGIEALESSDLDYTYMRMTWLYNAKKYEYVASTTGEPFLGAQISRSAVAQFLCDNIIGKRNDSKSSIGLWEPGSENKPKPDFY